MTKEESFMKKFSYYQPTDIRFGSGRLKEVGEAVSNFGKTCLLVTGSNIPSLEPMFTRLMNSLDQAGIAVAHFDGVIPNPTTETIKYGAAMARAHNVDVVLGVGGGSSMDSAKAIAVEASHEGGAWNYLFYKDTQPTEKTLPIITVSTTSGTGSQVTQVAVITNSQKRDKSAIYHPNVYPRIAIIDPELMISVPSRVTAATGFDIFCHAFESMLHPAASPYTNLMAKEAISLVFTNLTKTLKNPDDISSRSALAWADTLAGLCIANAGVTLPHGIGMAIGGMYPHVMHGETLALNYPAFTRFTYLHAISQFAFVGKSLNNSLARKKDEEAAEMACDELDSYLKKIGMWYGLSDFNIPKDELKDLANQSLVLPDYKNNPKIPTFEETKELLESCFKR